MSEQQAWDEWVRHANPTLDREGIRAAFRAGWKAAQPRYLTPDEAIQGQLRELDEFDTQAIREDMSADFTQGGCLPSGCSCVGHRMPGVRHMVPCCDEPHMDQLTAEADRAPDEREFDGQYEPREQGDGYVRGLWDEVENVFMQGHISEACYEALRERIGAADRARAEVQAAVEDYVELIAKIHEAYRHLVMDTPKDRAIHAKHIENADRALALARTTDTAALDRMLAEARVEAWDEGYRSGHSNAMRRMSDEPNASTTPNPYRAEGEGAETSE